jgi:hypothetical protein
MKARYEHTNLIAKDVAAAMDILQEHGGQSLGEIVSHEVSGVGLLTFVYATTNLEGNIVELQSWE